MSRPLSDELLARARQLSQLLDARRTAHAFIGGLALNAWTIPAPTFDIDLCAALAPEAVPELVRRLEEEGFAPPPTSWLESIGPARFQEFTVHWPFELGMRPADIFLATDPFQKEMLARSRRVELDTGFITAVATPEDLLIYKLLADRPKDRAAVERLLAVQQELDWAYVRRWTARFGLEERLVAALREAGLGSV